MIYRQAKQRSKLQTRKRGSVTDFDRVVTAIKLGILAERRQCHYPNCPWLNAYSKTAGKGTCFWKRCRRGKI